MPIRIRSLHCYPIKSCAGIDLAESPVDASGLAWDRRWMILSGRQFLTQRQLPAMALVRTTITDTDLRLEAPGMPALDVPLDGAWLDPSEERVTVWRDTVPARSEGTLAAQWLSDFLRRPCRLFRIDPAHARRTPDSEWVGRWLDAHPDLADDFKSPGVFGFADGYPVLIANQSSLDELNRLLADKGHEPVPMNRFRPNIVVEGDIEAYDEDHTALLRAGSVRMALVKPCTRCAIPDIDQATAQRYDEPGFTLMAARSFDLGVVFGQNAIVAAPAGARLRVGDEVDVEFDFR